MKYLIRDLNTTIRQSIVPFCDLVEVLIQLICLVPSFVYFLFIKCSIFLHLAKSTDTESVPNSTVEDGPGDGFTILSAKSLFLGQKVKYIYYTY